MHNWLDFALCMQETRITLPLDFTPQGVPRGVLGNALIVEFGSYDPQIGGEKAFYVDV